MKMKKQILGRHLNLFVDVCVRQELGQKVEANVH